MESVIYRNYLERGAVFIIIGVTSYLVAIFFKMERGGFLLLAIIGLIIWAATTRFDRG